MRTFAWVRAVRALLVLASLGGSAAAQVSDAPDVYARKIGSDVHLEWLAVPNATAYNVYRTAALVQPAQILGQTGTLAYSDVGVVPGPPANPRQLYYWVKATDGATEGPRSNMAFKLNIDLTKGSNYVSMPYRYTPKGPGIAGTSQDLCDENVQINSVTRYKSNVQGCVVPSNFSCGGSFGNFDLSAGKGHNMNLKTGITLNLVGAHDPAFTPGGPASNSLTAGVCGCNVSLVSVPYHAKAKSAEQLCKEFATMGKPLYQVEYRRFVPPTLVDHRCGFAANDFPLVPGTVSFLWTTTPTQWQPAVE